MITPFDELLKLFGQQKQQGAAPPVMPMSEAPAIMPGQPAPGQPVNAMPGNAFDNIMSLTKGDKSNGALGSILKLIGI